MAGAPDVKQLLELLKRAADELKVSQQETAVARTDAESFAKKLVKTEADLQAERDKSKRLQSMIDDFGSLTLPPTPREELFDEKTLLREHRERLKTSPVGKAVTLIDATANAPRLEESTNVTAGDPVLVEQRLKALSGELQSVDEERRALKDRLKVAEQVVETVKAREHELEGLLADARAELERSAAVATERDDLQRRLSQLEHEHATAREQLIGEQARGADLVTRLHAWEARAQELEQALASEQASTADNDALVTQNSQLEAELVSLRARATALEGQISELGEAAATEHRGLLDAQGRSAQLEHDLLTVRSRRDELNVELARVESERKSLRAKVAELEASLGSVKADEAKTREQLEERHRKALEALEAAKKKAIDEREATLARERAQAQATAAELAQTVTQNRTLEGELERAVTNVGNLDASIVRLNDAHAEELARLRTEHDAGVGNLQQRIAQLDGELDRANAEWRHVEKQYESLHREMLTLLDQRDEARRELAARR